ncbi:hypothetical protein MAM1_0208c08019 [Mucor ambiguus]|uniref:HTH APSES-type domain-containing protein n=1 Tax=Mucor ambiguus TaxID=91626 RepID=A0A0C9LWG9_9FUNG|nr:hypothetical protein MAM1_0208c08019 [Mucor ambiguus]
MPQKATSHVDQKSKQQKDGLPVSIHPDDAKDKVFTAILKALLKMGNKPSSPKELANTIVKHKYATLGGATPFATVSSRISQHFKRAAEHNPPRAPLLAKHVDQHHSRKINYSLATDSVSNDGSATETHDDDTATAANTTAADSLHDETTPSSKTRRSSKIISTKKLRSRTIMEEQQDDGDNEHDEEEDDDEHVLKKLKHSSRHSTSIHPSQKEPQPSTISGYSFPQTSTANDADPDNSDGDLSDYHEEMLKGDDTELDVPIHPGRRFSRRPSALHKSALTKPSTKSTAISTAPSKSKSNDTDITNTTITHTAPSSSLATTTTQEPVLPQTSSKATTTPTPALAATTTGIPPSSSASSTSKTLAPPMLDSSNGARKPSFSFSSGFPGDQELWTPFSFEHDFDNVFLQDASTAHHIPFHIATPESVSVSELDDYFASTSNAATRTQRKSFSSAMLGPNDKSLLQKVLLASAARGVADKIDEEDECASENKEDEKKQLSTSPPAASGNTSTESTSNSPVAATMTTATDTAKTTTLASATPTPSSSSADKDKALQAIPEATAPTSTPPPISSSSLMDVDNGEDFVKFEDDEKKEAPLPAPINTTLTTPPPAAKKVADILPATPTTLSAAEILKSMNIQNMNLSALHQMTSNIPSLQHLSPTFDLAKTMAAYMQSLAKSANANASSSNSPHAMDLKTILARFPALEAFIKKEPSPASGSGTATPPLMSPTTSNAATAAPITTTSSSSASSSTSATPSDFVPNLISGTHSPTSTTTAPSFTAGSTEPIVHTLTTMNPPMYITLIDHIAVCIVVLPKTDTTPEYRIMRRVDTGFINGTVLLTAGGIETESERSMILSFEMERVRMPKKKSQLFGTWIPLRRAQELAVTCSIQHKLGHFLEDSIESYFPSPLPIQINTRKPARDSRLTALALAALRSDTKNNSFIVPPISRQSSSSGSMAAAQLQELLLTHPHKALKSNGMLGNKAPLLGRYDDKNEPVLPAKAVSHHHHHHNAHRNNSSASASSINSSSGVSEKEDSDVDIVNSSDSSAAASSNEEESDSEADDKSRKSATSASSSQQQQPSVPPQPPTINLEEILNRVTPKQPMHIHPRDLQKKRRRSSIVAEKDKEEPMPKATKSSHSRKKNSSSSSGSGSGSSSGGKWSNNTKSSASVAIKKSSGGSGTTITIKRPTSSHVAHSSTSAATATTHASKKSNTTKKEEELDNVVVEHKAESMQPSAAKSATTSTTDEENDDEDSDEKEASKVVKVAASSVATQGQDDDDEDDEDIDIGGSDFDDDLR